MLEVFPRHEIFDGLAAENRAPVYGQRTSESRLLMKKCRGPSPTRYAGGEVPRCRSGGAISDVASARVPGIGRRARAGRTGRSSSTRGTP